MSVINAVPWAAAFLQATVGGVHRGRYGDDVGQSGKGNSYELSGWSGGTIQATPGGGVLAWQAGGLPPGRLPDRQQCTMISHESEMKVIICFT